MPNLKKNFPLNWLSLYWHFKLISHFTLQKHVTDMYLSWLKWKGFNSFCCHLCSFCNFLGNSLYKVLTFVRLVFTAAELKFSNSLFILHFTSQTYMSECQNIMFEDTVSLLNRFQKELDQNRLLGFLEKCTRLKILVRC